MENSLSESRRHSDTVRRTFSTSAWVLTIMTDERLPGPWGSTTAGFIVTTTPTVEGRPIREYHGVVTGEAVLGANLFRDLFASIRDIVGGRSGSYERVLREARDAAISEMSEEAQRRGANAVVGVDLDYETVGEAGAMLMVSASGTAVRI